MRARRGPDRTRPAGMDPNFVRIPAPGGSDPYPITKTCGGLGTSYMRVSGTWANTTYFSDSDNAPSAPPAGFNGVLIRQQWRGVVDFSKAVDERIVSSFAISPGARDAAGVWIPGQARRFLAMPAAGNSACR